MRDKILRELKGIEFLEGNIKEDTKLDSFLDSIEVLELIMEVEKKYNFSISDCQIEKTKTIGDIIDLIIKK